MDLLKFILFGVLEAHGSVTHGFHKFGMFLAFVSSHIFSSPSLSPGNVVMCVAVTLQHLRFLGSG